MKHIFLYGPPGTGKSAVSKILAGNLCLPFIDLDTVVAQQAGCTLADIMDARGEAAFREMESAALRQAVSLESHIIALGGGTLLPPENRSLAESVGTVVCLDTCLETLVRRLSADENPRPLLAGDLRGKLAMLLETRQEHYRSFPLRLTVDSLEMAQVAWQIQIALGRFRVSGMGQAYDVLVQPGGLDDLGCLLRERRLNGPLALVTGSNVGPLYAGRAERSLQAAGYQVHVITIPAGEGHKTLETVSLLWSAFLHAGLERQSTVVALGGGVTGDLAGFAASTFVRGVAWVGVPTSLLAMVDASLGGKTGFNLREGKNLVGSFTPPQLVLADPQVLTTLPEAELRSGLAEVVKHAVISDPDLFAQCAAGYDIVCADLASVVRRSMAVKVAIIEADPYERGIRAALNYGHTVGHTVETLSGYRLRHGEAIAIGMVAEARLAEGLTVAGIGLSECILAVLTGLGLPTAIPPNLAAESILQSMKVDKKKSAGSVRFTLPVEIGKVETGVKVDDLDLRGIL
jgi:shikimate kinase/3-dehydroquinate synthase